MLHSRLARVMSLGAFAAALPQAAMAEDSIRAVTMFPQSIIFVKKFLNFVEDVNKQGKGVVQIKVIGGPEAIPGFQQAEAVSKGLVDMTYGSANYYQGRVPEVEALAISNNLTAMDMRKNGGFALLDEIHRKKLGVKFFMVLNTGMRFNIFMKSKPKLLANGMPDMKGVKLRSNPLYRDFLASLQATPISIKIPEIYTALERGTVDGIAWTRIGIADLGWHKFLRYRIEPGFSQVESSAIINLKKWQSLSPKSRDLLTRLAMKHEQVSHDEMKAEAEKEAKKLKDLTVFRLDAKTSKQFVKQASDVSWARIKKRDATYYDRLRKVFAVGD